MAQSFEEKIEALRKQHLKSHPDALRQIQDWAFAFAQLRVQKDWIDHPNTLAMKEAVEDAIGRIDAVLVTNDKLEEVERKALFAEKRAHLSYLALLSEDPTDEMKSIEASVESEL